MLVITDTNINTVFPIGIMHLNSQGVRRESRNGPTIEIMDEVCVTYKNPKERVLFEPNRDCNPFFHMFEALWMLSGRDDVKFLERYNKSFAQFSDDGIRFNAAYGKRLRDHFGFDQLEAAVSQLKANRDDRRVVLTLWDPQDLNKVTKDMACNLVITLRYRNQALDMTVFNRSNDYLWGLAGANVVHMSMIHEYIAGRLGIPVGKYSQITNCLHVYTEFGPWQKVKGVQLFVNDPYENGTVIPYDMFDEGADPDLWDKDLKQWMDDPITRPFGGYHHSFFENVAMPMAIAHYMHEEHDSGLAHVHYIQATDWRLACRGWLERRETK